MSPQDHNKTLGIIYGFLGGILAAAALVELIRVLTLEKELARIGSDSSLQLLIAAGLVLMLLPPIYGIRPVQEKTLGENLRAYPLGPLRLARPIRDGVSYLHLVFHAQSRRQTTLFEITILVSLIPFASWGIVCLRSHESVPATTNGGADRLGGR